MTEKSFSGECNSCESSFSVEFVEEMVSQDVPEFCPFCGEHIEDISEDYIEDDDFDENEEWES